jgi:membrane-bound lytic murein transglycosylase F
MGMNWKTISVALCLLAGMSLPWWGVGWVQKQSAAAELHFRKLANVLTVGVLQSPSIYQLNHEDKPVGLEFELTEAFAQSQNKVAKYIVFADLPSLSAALLKNEIDLAPIGFQKASLTPHLLSTREPYLKNNWSLVFASGQLAAKDWLAVGSANVWVIPRIWFTDRFSELRASLPLVNFALAVEQEEGLIASLSAGEYRYALVDDHLFELTQHIFFDVGKAFTVHQDHRAWLMHPRNAALQFSADMFLVRSQHDQVLAHTTERYFAHTQKLKMNDLAVFESRIIERLPAWRAAFQRAQVETGIEWRMLAALAYQESHWDAMAVSETAVQGLMQLTQDTASRYKTDRNNPTAAISAGARYLADIWRTLPARIAEPDRLWLAMAGYNIGPGHVEDARILAVKSNRNPDAWADVKKMLPLLAVPHIAAKTKHGKARGGMPVEYVESIRAYHELLLRHESAFVSL